MSIGQMKEAAADGAYVELVYHSLLAGGRLTIAGYVDTIRAVGAEHCILSSDLGQADSPVHTVGWKTYLEQLKKAGVTEAEIDLMARRNPARLLGLE
jgi:predicted metal-dependent TIM-barrel fold hydrolase